MTENTMIAFYSTRFKNKIKLAMVVIYNMVDKFNASSQRSLSESFCIDRRRNYKTNIYFARERQWFILIFISTFVQREIRRLVFETWFSPFHFHGCAANAGHAEQALNFLISVSDEGRREGRSRKGREKQRVAQTALLFRADENPG